LNFVWGGQAELDPVLIRRNLSELARWWRGGRLKLLVANVCPFPKARAALLLRRYADKKRAGDPLSQVGRERRYHGRARLARARRPAPQGSMYLRMVLRSRSSCRAIAETDNPCRCKSKIMTSSPNRITAPPLPPIGRDYSRHR
jgi:hypothetical protein